MQKTKQDQSVIRAEKILVEAIEKFCDEFGSIPTAFWAQVVLNHLSTLNKLEIKDIINKSK